MEVNEELVRQNGNQAAAVMADFTAQGGGGGGGGLVISRDTGTVFFRAASDSDMEKLPPLNPNEEIEEVADINGIPVVLMRGSSLSQGDLFTGLEIWVLKDVLSNGSTGGYGASYVKGNQQTGYLVSDDLTLLAKVLVMP